MKLDGINSVPETQPTERQGPNNLSVRKGASEETAAVQDQTQLSVSKDRVDQLKAGLAQLPDIRSEQVQALQAAIRDGSYHVTDQRIAQALASDLLGLGSSEK